jgi:hypothetical protein
MRRWPTSKGQALGEMPAGLQDGAVDVSIAGAEFGDRVNCPAPATSPTRTATP